MRSRSWGGEAEQGANAHPTPQPRKQAWLRSGGQDSQNRGGGEEKRGSPPGLNFPGQEAVAHGTASERQGPCSGGGGPVARSEGMTVATGKETGQGRRRKQEGPAGALAPEKSRQLGGGSGNGWGGRSRSRGGAGRGSGGGCLLGQVLGEETEPGGREGG